MAGLDQTLAFLERRFEHQVRAHQVLPSNDGVFHPFPPNLHPTLREALLEAGVTRLFAHQADAFELIANGRDTVLVSRTASGKTLAFLLPVLDRYLKSEAPFSALLLYPTKALSRDQEGTLATLLRRAGVSTAPGTFDGDTPREQRHNLQRQADFIITNPDMLHAGILPNHNRRWRSFLSRLAFLIVDEVHTYRGAFGSHVANVMRRLLRVCALHGASPRIICSSATVGNPGEHVRRLFGREFAVVDRDGSPRPRRELYLVNPPLVRGAGETLYRKGPGSITVPVLREAVRNGVRTICFCRARQQVERLYRAVVDRQPRALAERVKPYRGGLLPNERRRLERDLFSGRITAIISTNALELGIDIGDLDLCLLSGYPGTMAAFWQQAGRVGRRHERAAIVFVARDAPIDQYLVHHPEFVLSAPIEQAWLNADNPYILLQHLPCAAHEHPLRPDEEGFAGPVYELAVNVLEEDGNLKPYREMKRYAGRDYPARGVNLRGMTDYNVDIYCGTEVIGEIDPIGARGTLYRDAIYQHLGRKYMSMELDLEKKLCRVEPVEVDYYTEAVWENRIEMTERFEGRTLRDAALNFGAIHVNKQPKLYKKVRERTFENVGYGPITLPPFEYDTTGFSLLPPAAWRALLDQADKRFPGAALYGLSYLLKRVGPSVCMADPNDIETDVHLHDQGARQLQSALFLYDRHEGGVGYAEKIFENLEDVLVLCRGIIEECECESGCPACVPPLPPGVDDREMEELLIESDASRVCTAGLLAALIDGRLELPRVSRHTVPLRPAVTPPPPDLEQERTRQRLRNAAVILRAKRDRTH